MAGVDDPGYSLVRRFPNCPSFFTQDDFRKRPSANNLKTAPFPVNQGGAVFNRPPKTNSGFPNRSLFRPSANNPKSAPFSVNQGGALFNRPPKTNIGFPNRSLFRPSANNLKSAPFS